MGRLIKADPVEWSEDSLQLPASVAAAQPGPLRLFPWQRDVLRSLCSPGRTTLRVASQMGKTQLMAARVAYAMAEDRSSVVYAVPTQDDYRRFHADRLWPTIQASPELRELVGKTHRTSERVSETNLRWPGGQMQYMAAASGRQMRGVTAPVLLFDELDAAPGSLDARNPVDMLRQRGEGYPSSRVTMALSSTPRRGGMIDQYYEEGNQSEWFVRCATCGARFVWEFKPEYAALGWLPCVGCGRQFTDREALGMNNAGEWVAAFPERADRSYHITQLSSAFKTHSETLAEYSPVSPSGFYTQKLATSYEDIMGSLEVKEESEIWSPERPWPAHYATVGVDVQGDRLEYQVVEFDEYCTTAWVYEHRVLHHGPEGEDATWEALARAILQPAVQMVFIDTGYEPDAVRTQCRRVFGPGWWQSVVFGAHSGKGSDTLDNPAGLIQANTPSGDVRIGTQQAKSALAAMLGAGRIKVRPEGVFRKPGRWNYLQQLQSERLISSLDGKTMRWEKRSSGVRNETLDCFCYAICAAVYLNSPQFRARQRRGTGR